MVDNVVIALEAIIDEFGIARGADFEIFTRPDRITDGVESDVA